MRVRVFSLVGKTVAFRTIRNDWFGTYREIGILKVDAVHPDGSEVGGVDDEGESIWCHTADILRVF